MSDGCGGAIALLDRAVEAVLAECPVELPEPLALARCSALIVARERLEAATLVAVGDVDRRELFTLDEAGSTRGWLRTQLGGDDGQVGRARRLQSHDAVLRAQAAGEIAGRAAGQLCSALDKVPEQVDDDTLAAVLVDGLQTVLGRQLGRGLPDHLDPTAAHLALRKELAGVVRDALEAGLVSPAARLEPALVLVARTLAPGQVAWALKWLLDALVPDGLDKPDERDFYLDLVPVLGGDWDLRGHLDHETGTLLCAELARQRRAREAADAAALRAEAAAAGAATAKAEADGVEVPSPELDAFGRPARPESGALPRPLRTKSRQRHDELTQLLRDAADRDAGNGRPAPVAITIIASVDAIEGRSGALPGMVCSAGFPVNLSAETLQRMGCFSELTAVLLDAAGRPVGASTTLRSADHRQRVAQDAVWGPFCAVAGCTSTATVPHHLRPWWLSRETVLKDLVPLCDHDHHSLHEGHRTLRLKDGRKIDDHGWVTDTARAP